MRRILVIDDEAQIRRLLEITLSNLGWEVFTAPTGLEGLESARGAKPKLILLDLNLPDMTGAELLRRLRQWSTIPVIVISVRDSERDIVELLNAGADDYVAKPFYTNELVARIEATIGAGCRGASRSSSRDSSWSTPRRARRAWRANSSA